MELTILVIVAILLIVASTALVVWHLTVWREAQGAGLEIEELDFRRRQFRRRMQTSIMLGLIGLALPIGNLISPRQTPSLFVFYWWGVGLLVAWLGLLALGDAISTRQHLLQMQRRFQRELDLTRQELLKREGNGTPRKQEPGN